MYLFFQHCCRTIIASNDFSEKCYTLVNQKSFNLKILHLIITYQLQKQGVFLEQHQNCTGKIPGQQGYMEQSPEFCDKHLESGTSKNLPDFSLGRINLFHQKKTLELMECCNHIKKILSIFNTFVFILCIYMKPLLYISKNSGTAKCIVWRRSSG